MSFQKILCPLLVFFVALLISSSVIANETEQVAIIIDDFGGEVKGVDSFLTGTIPITVAVMPFMEHSTAQAEKAHEAGLEVMIHMPMEPKKGKASWLGPKAITSDLSNEEIRKRVIEAIENVPHAKGINNHMGSKIVEDERIIRVILEVCAEYGLYIVDSGTSPNSVITRLANELDIPCASRSIFLDDTLSSRQHVQKQMGSLLRLAKKNKKAIAIGHVGIKGHETFAGIENTLSLFQKEKVAVVPISHLLDTNVDKDHSDFWKPKEKKEPTE